MFRNLLTISSAIAILFATASCREKSTSPPSPQPTASATKSIVLGDISNEPVERIQQFQPLADYLAANLGKFGIGRGEVKIVPDMESMVKSLKSGEIDLYFDSLYPALIASEQSGAVPILRRWKDGHPEYYTVIFTRANSGITALEDLKGKTLGLEEEVSTSGYLMPMAYLLGKGLNLVEKPNPNASVAADDVGYVFTGDNENTIQWVLNDKVVAGAVDNLTFAKIPDETEAALKVLAKTEKVARHLVLIRADIDPAERDAIAALLRNLDKTEEGQKILQQFEQTTKFDRFPSEASLQEMQKLYQQVQTQRAK